MIPVSNSGDRYKDGTLLVPISDSSIGFISGPTPSSTNCCSSLQQKHQQINYTGPTLHSSTIRHALQLDTLLECNISYKVPTKRMTIEIVSINLLNDIDSG